MARESKEALRRRWPGRALLAVGAVLVFGLGWATGRFVRPAAAHASSTQEQHIVTPAPKPPVELMALLDFCAQRGWMQDACTTSPTRLSQPCLRISSLPDPPML